MTGLRLALISSPFHRQGPDSRLARFFREFHPFLAMQKEVWMVPSGIAALKEVGLDAEKKTFHPSRVLTAGRHGGLVELASMVAQDPDEKYRDIDAVIYFISPNDPASIYPETAALKRECVMNRIPFLPTYMSAVEWVILNWYAPGDPQFMDESHELPLDKQNIALISHDRFKPDMMKLCLVKHREIIDKFAGRFGTGATGKSLCGDEATLAAIQHVMEKAHEEKVNAGEDDEFGAEDLDVFIDTREKLKSDSMKPLDVTEMAFGPRGGVVQIASMVNALNRHSSSYGAKGAEPIHKVIFFEDPHHAREHESDIQLLERACHLNGDNVVCLNDLAHATDWAEGWSRVAKEREGAYQLPVTVLRGVERMYGKDQPLRVCIADPEKRRDNETSDESALLDKQQMVSICEEGAWYVLSMINHIWLREKKREGSVRVVIPWGYTGHTLIKRIDEIISSEFDIFDGKRPKVKVIAMSGIAGTQDPKFEANFLAEKLRVVFAKRCDAEAITVPGAAFIGIGHRPEKEPPQIKRAVEQAKEADLVILSGRPIQKLKEPSTSPILRGLYNEMKKKAVGEAGGIFLDAKGALVEPKDQRRIGVTLEDLIDINRGERGKWKRVVLLVGCQKGYAEFARATLRSGAVSTLITDREFARDQLLFEGAKTKKERWYKW